MAPMYKPVVRQIVTFGVIIAQNLLTFQLHTFTGRAHDALLMLDLLLLLVSIQLLIKEGRERERLGRP